MRRHALAFMLVAGFTVFAVAGACTNADDGGFGGASPPGAGTPASHGGPVIDYVSLVDALRAAGATVEPAGEVSQPFFSVIGLADTVNGAPVQVFEYADEAAAAAAAATIAPDGGAVGTTSVLWIAPPHFYRAGRLLVLYVGDDAAVTGLLDGALGPQFAGR